MERARADAKGRFPAGVLDWPPLLRAMRLSSALPLLFAGAAAAQTLEVFVPPENPLSPAKIVLGKILFWEEQLSQDDSVACGTCHQPEVGGVDPRDALHPGPDGAFGTGDDIHGSMGVPRMAPDGSPRPSPWFGTGPQVTNRAANSAIGAAWHAELFWDGRAGLVFHDPETGEVAIRFGGALENQAVWPILNEIGMSAPGRTWDDVRKKLEGATPLALATDLPPDVALTLEQSPTYPELFRRAFGDGRITARRIAFAIASYERTLIPDRTPYDLWAAGDRTAMTPEQQLGLEKFLGIGRCMKCHAPPLFTDDFYHTLGLRPWQEDPGRMKASGIEAERGAFKSPSLRNAGLRPRLFHDGSLAALGSVAVDDPRSAMNFYFKGGGTARNHADNLDPYIIDLSANGAKIEDMRLIEEFVRTALTDRRVAGALPPFDHPTLRSARICEPPSARPGSTRFSPPVAIGVPGILFVSRLREPSLPFGRDSSPWIAGAVGSSASAVSFAIPKVMDVADSALLFGCAAMEGRGARTLAVTIR
ncbi:MAG: hypothetical protein Fur0037_01670 [Planctomycetota bacterium]